MRLKVRLTGSWTPSPNEDGPATFVRRASAEPGALQVSWAEYGGGPLPNPTAADLEDLAKKFGREQEFGDPTDSRSGACAFGAFGSAAFRTAAFAWIRVWFLSNGRDFINVTHICETEPDPAERAEADEIARSLSLGPGDADAPSTITRGGDRDDSDHDRPDRQHVAELTTLMRTEPRWRDVRDCLADNGHSPASVLLADLLEEDEGRQYGVVVTRDRRVFRFVRDPIPEDVTGARHVTSFREITHRPRRVAFVRERVEAALAMIHELPAPDPSTGIDEPAVARRAPAGRLRGWVEKVIGRKR